MNNQPLWYIVGYYDKDKPNAIIHEANPKMYYEGGDITSRSCGYETEEELRKGEKIFYDCVSCGAPAKTNYAHCERMKEDHLCFNCDFWKNEVNLDKCVRIEGRSYQIGPEHPKGYQGFLGFGGREFHIEFDDGRCVISHNLWTQGEIPTRFAKDFPDNAKFSNGEGWVKIGDVWYMNAGAYQNGSEYAN